MSERTRQLPLAGIRVLDLSAVVMGPVCTQILADYGAEVIKVEPPEGDIMRHAGAPCGEGLGAMFVHTNEGKKSVVIDLKQAGALAALKSALPSFDVLVHNIRPLAMARLGLDVASVRRHNRGIVYAELTGYGRAGPLADRAAFDDIIQAQAGIADLVARQSGGEPMYVPTLIADRITGMTAAHAILAALVRRQRDAAADVEGDTIQVSMFETMAALVLADHMGGRSVEPPSGTMGYSRLLTPHRRPYRTRDGYIAAVVYNDKHWRSFFEAIGEMRTYLSDERFRTAGARATSYDFIYGHLAVVMRSRTTAEWIQLLEAADIPCSRVVKIEELLDDPQLAAMNFFEFDKPATGPALRRINARYRSPLDRDEPPRRAPSLGEHDAEFPELNFARNCK